MVRQDQLESLADPGQSDKEMYAARGVAAFIQEFLGDIRADLIDHQRQIERQASGEAEPEQTGNPHMDISPDLDDFDPPGLTERH